MQGLSDGHGVALSAVRRGCGGVLLAAVLALPGTAGAAPSGDPDNPCVRVLVPELSPALIWAGPPIDDLEPGAWRSDPEVAELVLMTTDRRVPREEAMAAIDTFAEALPAAEKQDRLVLLFAGAFEMIQDGRGESLDAIRRYAEGQRILLDRIAAHLKALETLPEGSDERAGRQEALAADRRVLDDRRRMLTAVCDRPVLFEQRLGQIARAIAPHLPAE